MRPATNMSRALRALGLAAAVAGLGGCGSGSAASTNTNAGTTNITATTGGATTSTAVAKALVVRHTRPAPPSVVVASLGSAPAPFAPVVHWRGQTAAWTSRSATGIALLRLDQRLVRLHLHSGTLDAGAGFPFGPAVDSRETGRLVAAFNGGFRLNLGVGGFMAGGHVGATLREGLGSVVTYAEGQTDIGAWHAGVPAPGQSVASVRQNLPLLIDQGSAADTVNSAASWGATLGGVSNPARSALGITGGGQLVWAGGEHATVAQLVQALLGARVVRAVELDINPEWVAGYVYAHHGRHGPLSPLQLVPGQHGVPGFFLSPYSRDFFVVVAR
jgi:hypothetical protein